MVFYLALNIYECYITLTAQKLASGHNDRSSVFLLQKRFRNDLQTAKITNIILLHSELRSPKHSWWSNKNYSDI